MSDDKPSQSIYEPLKYEAFNAPIAALDVVQCVPHSCAIKGANGGFPTSADGWFATVFSSGGRAFDKAVWPFLLVSANAVFWTVLVNASDDINPYRANIRLDKTYSYGLAFTLGLILSFRLNRSILRFWTAMTRWGNMVVTSRSMVSSILVHGRDNPYHRDQIVCWTAAISIALKRRLRQLDIESSELLGILTKEQIEDLKNSNNPPLYAANMVRRHLKQVMDVRPDMNHSPLSPARSGEMRQHERYLDGLIHNGGNLESILATPMPLIYVAHIRSFLIIYLVSLPYLLGALWEWSTIVIVPLIAAIYLGLEAASSEVESPFDKGRSNDLDLDLYCFTILKNIQQLVKRRNEKDGLL